MGWLVLLKPFFLDSPLLFIISLKLINKFVLLFLIFFMMVITGCTSPITPSTSDFLGEATAFRQDTSLPQAELDPTTIPLPVTSTPRLLTLETIRNLDYQLNFSDKPRSVKLKNGIFQGEDRTDVRLFDQVLFKDLNDDGLDDAAVLIGENFGGTGTFVALVVLLNQNGQPVQFGAVLVDDRPKITSLEIEDGQIILEALVHGVGDPMCCPTMPVTRTYQLGSNGLVMVNQTSFTPGGAERVITIEQPLDNSQVSGSIQVKGTVSISPFENNLVFAIFNDQEEELMRGPFAVESDEIGGPGTFDNLIEIKTIPAGTSIRLELSELSLADGSLLAMDSVNLKVK